MNVCVPTVCGEEGGYVSCYGSTPDLREGGDEEGVTCSSSSPGNGDDLGSSYQSYAGNDTLLKARVMCYIGTGIASEGIYSKESWSDVLHHIRTCIRLTHTPLYNTSNTLP